LKLAKIFQRQYTNLHNPLTRNTIKRNGRSKS
jgi:hypothetical protein